jgi:anti-sigma regulatory factor (Ser/Thr protein kinase)
MATSGTSGNGALSFELRNDLAELPVLVEHLEGFCEQHDIGPEVLSVVTLALEEILTNIISSGDADGGDRQIRVDLIHDGANITARVEDDAAAVDLNLVRTLMDEVSYSREQNRSVLLIRKATV